MTNRTKIFLLIGGIILAGGAYYFIRKSYLKRKYEIIEDRGFEIMVEK